MPKVTKTNAALAVLAAAAIAVPSATARPIDSGPYPSVNAITGQQGGSGHSVKLPHGAEYSSVNGITPPASESSSASASPETSSGYSSLNAISGPSPSEPTIVSGSPSSSDDGFEWGDAALGAGAALALLALGRAVFLTVRRRTAVSPTTASMS